MQRSHNLPSSSLVPIETRRLRLPEVVWEGPRARQLGFDPSRVFCRPQDASRADLYETEYRTEHADRYGGIGTGPNGGSGRCSIDDMGLQTKGVGVTPLVAPAAEEIHNSGVVHLMEACIEAIFGEAYSYCLPFGSVPVVAVVLTGEEYSIATRFDPLSLRRRTLVVRPFVTRPAHFLRNLKFRAELERAGPDSPGLSRDAARTVKAMEGLAHNLHQALCLSHTGEDEIAVIDQGLRELARRFAWQAAAAFAKRLPHGTLSCSNVALSGSYLDYGLSNHVRCYRRLTWPTWLDPWSEQSALLKTLLTLRQQLETYHPRARGKGIASSPELAELFRSHYEIRESIELSKMAGLSEDIAIACPTKVLNTWAATMRQIYKRGADEPFLTQFPGLMTGGVATPPPRATGRFDLTDILKTYGESSDAPSMDARLSGSLTDAHLRSRFVGAVEDVRSWLKQWAGADRESTIAFMRRQATRKNGNLDCLSRAPNGAHAALAGIEALPEAAKLASRHIHETLVVARRVLTDLDPDIRGANGAEQLRNLHQALMVAG